MTIAGNMIIGQELVQGSKKAIYAVNPATGDSLEPAYLGGGADEVSRACALAEKAFDVYRETDLETRAKFLEQIATNLSSNGPAIIERAGLESGLPKARLEGELGRTMSQLKLFAEEIRAGHWLGVKIDAAMPERTPLPRSDIRLRYIPLGPVAVFGASNFPLAFSVAGGDTVSALSAGCPVVVKGHSAHPGTSELVGMAIQSAIKSCGMPEGTFSLLFGSGSDIGASLVADPRIKAVGFTGSRSGGMALIKIAASRSEPIPVYAEMSSINPVYLFPEALKHRADIVATGFVNSLLMGSGQFCTNPGLLIVREASGLDAFISKVAELVTSAQPTTMLTPGIHHNYEAGVMKLKANVNVQILAEAKLPNGPNQCRARLFVTTADAFLKDHKLRDEIFGSSSLVIRCKTDEEILVLTNNLEGQLTATVLMDRADNNTLIKTLVSILERKVGRILFNGYPTGVEVCHAIVHGGPFPATSDSRTTSVGTEAIWRFLRPVSYQDFPADLLPQALKDDGWKVPKLINGK
jgi:NADP-dependent aldehyde dehydrogenase